MTKNEQRRVKDAANHATEIAKSKGHWHAAIEHGLAIACAGQPAPFKNMVRAELKTRGYRI